MIALIDYGAGNLASVRKALAVVAGGVRIPVTAGELGGARGIVVPGVGHFGATRALTAEWVQAIHAAVERGASLLGICLGMHWLFDGSDEAPDARGLGVLPGRCRRLDAGGLKVPHVGWNELEPGPASRLLDGVERGAQVYFTHSYVAPVVDDTTATTRHGAAIFSSVVERGRVAGVQFHPEKSGAVGLRLLRNWVDAL